MGSGGATGSISSGTVADNGALEFNLSGNTTFSSAVSGTGSLVQAGGGVLILTGSNTYTGGSTINAGLLQFNGDSTVSTTGTITINSGGALVLASSGTLYTTVAGWLSSNKIAVASPGAVALIAPADSETINMGNYASLSLGASGNVTYSGTSRPAAQPITSAEAVARSPSRLQSPVPWASTSTGRGP